jgi:hypothetical protein
VLFKGPDSETGKKGANLIAGEIVGGNAVFSQKSCLFGLFALPVTEIPGREIAEIQHSSRRQDPEYLAGKKPAPGYHKMSCDMGSNHDIERHVAERSLPDIGDEYPEPVRVCAYGPA